MEKLQRRIGVALLLCFAAVVAGAVAQLALTDIFHGEADVRLEWRAVQIADVVVATAVIYAAHTLFKVRAFLRSVR
jgi:hypothetical protein